MYPTSVKYGVTKEEFYSANAENQQHVVNEVFKSIEQNLFIALYITKSDNEIFIGTITSKVSKTGPAQFACPCKLYEDLQLKDVKPMSMQLIR
jgi:hypothetical protein